MEIYGYLADVLVAVHVAYVGFVVVGQFLILLGWPLGWRWIRNFGFRLAHLMAIAIVALESVFHVTCPLTTWEGILREWAGQQVSDATFLGRCLHAMIFHEWPPIYFDIGNVAFALLVLVTFVLVPPRWPWRRGHL